MEAKKLTVNQAKNLVNDTKAIYRLCGFETGQTDKTEIDIFEMFYMFLSDCQVATNYYSFEDFQTEFGGTKENYNACKRALQKFCRVFDLSHIDLYNLANYMQEKYDF